MNIFEGKTIDEVYPEICERILEEEFITYPRGQKTKDIGPTSLVIHEPWFRVLTNRRRKINPYFLIAEWLWIITRQHRADMLGFYNKKMFDFSDDGRNLYGAYGPRLMYQLPSIINKIKMDPNTRQAIATIFRPADQLIVTKDFPCNIMLHFLPRNGTLTLVVYVRSQDVLLGLPYDFYHWSLILEMISVEVNMKMGSITHICGSLHGYEKDFNTLEMIADTDDSDCIEFEEPPVTKLTDSIRALTTMEYQIRKAQLDGEGFSDYWDQISATEEDEVIKNQLGTLLYYRIRRKEGFDLSKAIKVTGHYEPLLKHLGWT
jgi:thymidylate synthase